MFTHRKGQLMLLFFYKLRSSWLCVFWLAMLFCFVPMTMAQGDARTLFTRDAPLGWKKVRDEISKNCSVSVTPFYDNTNSSHDSPDELLTITILGSCELTQTVSEGNDSGTYSRIHAANERYSFSLAKANVEAPLILMDYFDNTQQLRKAHQWRHGLLQGNIAFFDGIMIEGEWLEDFFKSRDIEIISVEKTEENNITVAFRGKHKVDSYNVVHGGVVTFMPSSCWVVRSYQIEVSVDHPKFHHLKGTLKKEINYQDFDGVPFPQLSSSTYTESSNDKKNSIVYKYDKPNRISNDKAIFYLSHYGFSEPVDPKQGINTFRIVAMTIGILLIIIGLYMRYFVLRKK